MEKVCTPFCDASCSGEHHRILQALVKCPEKEVSVEQSAELQTLAHTVRQCMDEGWKKNMEIPEKDVRLRFPTLHWAAVLGRLSAVSFLVNEGCDPKLQTSEGHTALHRVCLRMFECFQHQGIAHRARTKLKRLVELLNDSLAIKDSQFLTPLLLACESYMMSQGIVMNEFYSTLISSIGQIAKSLPFSLKDIVLNSRNSDGDTALHILAGSDIFAPCLSTLLLSGANPTVRNKLSQLPFDIASQMSATRNMKQLHAASSSFMSTDLVKSSNENESQESSEESSLSESHGSVLLDGKTSPHTGGVKWPPTLKPTRTVSAPIAPIDGPVLHPRTVPKLVIQSKEGGFICTNAPIIPIEPSSHMSHNNAPAMQNSPVSAGKPAVGPPKKIHQKSNTNTVAPPPLMSYPTPSSMSSSPFSSVVEDVSTLTAKRDVEKVRDMPKLVKPSHNSHGDKLSNPLPSAAVLSDLIANRSGEKLIGSIDNSGPNRKNIIDINGILSGNQAPVSSSVSLVQFPILQPSDKHPHTSVSLTTNEAITNVLRFSAVGELESVQICSEGPIQTVSHKRRHTDFESGERVEKIARYDGINNDMSDSEKAEMAPSHLSSLEKYVASQAEEMDMSMKMLEARKVVSNVHVELPPSSEVAETHQSSQNAAEASVLPVSSVHIVSGSNRPSVSQQSNWLARAVNSVPLTSISNGFDVSLPWVCSEQTEETESVASIVSSLPEVDTFVSKVQELMTSSDTREMIHMLADAEISQYKRKLDEAQKEYQAADEGAIEFEVRHGIKVSLVRSLTKQVNDVGSLIESSSDQHDECLYKVPRLEEKLSKLKGDFSACKRVMKAHNRLQTNLPLLYKSATKRRERLYQPPPQLVAQVDKASVTDQYQMINSQRHSRRLLTDTGTAGGSPIHQPSYQ